MTKKILCIALALCILSALIVIFPMSSYATGASFLSTTQLANHFGNSIAEIQSAHCWYEGCEVTAQIKFRHFSQPGILYVAIYADDKLISLQGKAVEIGEMKIIVKLTDTDEIQKDYSAKIFYWDGDSLLKPLMVPVESELSSPVSQNYGFIIETSTYDNIYRIKLLDKTGNITEYNLAEKISFSDAKGIVNTTADAATVYNAISKLKGPDWVQTTNNITAIDNYAKRIITYDINENDEISGIVFAGARADGNVYQEAIYNANTKSFVNAASINESTVVFDIPVGRSVTTEDYSVETIDVFTHKEVYSVGFLSTDENNVAKVMIVTNNNNPNKIVISDASTIMTPSSSFFPSVIKGTDGDYLSVYDDEIDSSNTTYTLDATAMLIVNGQEMGYLSANISTYMYNHTGFTSQALGFIYAPTYSTVTLIDGNNDQKYEYMLVKSYETVMVDDIVDKTGAKKIYTKNDSVIDLTQHIEGKAGYTYNLTLNGVKATFSDLKENDILSISMSKNKKNYDIKATRKTVSGWISEMDYTWSNIADYRFVVNDIIYKVANLENKANSNLNRSMIGDEVILYLDAFDNVALVEKTTVDAKNYAFIIGAGSNASVGNTTYQLRLLDKNGNIKTYNLASKIRFTEANNNGIWTAGVNPASVYSYVVALQDSSWIQTTSTPAAIDNYAKRIVTFKTNEKDEISVLSFASIRTNGKEYYLTYNSGDVKTNIQYNSKTQTFIDSYSVDEDTVVFNLPINANATRDDFAINTIDSFSHGKYYDVAFLSIDEYGVSDVMIVVNNESYVVPKPDPEPTPEPEPVLSSSKYGFIVGAGYDVSVGDTTYQVRLLDKEGNLATYALAEKLRYAAAGANGVVTSGVAAATVYADIALLEGAGWINTAAAATVADINAYANRIITYKTNSDGDIAEIILSSPRIAGNESYLTYNSGDVKTNIQYNSKTQTFIDSYSVDEDTVVFNLPINANATRDDFAIESTNIFQHRVTYDVAFLSVDESNIAKVMIVVNYDPEYTQNCSLAVVKKTLIYRNSDYESIYKLTFFQNGEEKTLFTTHDLEQNISRISPGHVFEYAIDKNGDVCTIALGQNEGYMWDGSISSVKQYGSRYSLNGAIAQYVFGIVYGKTNNGILTIGSTRDKHAISDNTNFYLIDLYKAKNNISISSYDEIKAYKEDPRTGYVLEDNDYAVFMKYYNDEITDVIIYKGAISTGYIVY